MKQPKQKVHSLTGRITPVLVLQAFKTVKRNRGAAGIDKVSIQMFEANLEANLQALMRDLKEGTFVPQPLRRVYIPKSPTSMRPLGIPAVRDRVAQEVVRCLINPTFEPLFHENSFGFRQGRNAHMAMENVFKLASLGYVYVLDADIKSFFDKIPHQVMMQAVAAEIADGNILRLVEKFLAAGVMENGVFKPTNIGTPQGGVVSPLLSNIVLNRLDWYLEEQGIRFVRYADDFVVLAKSKQQAEGALDSVKHFLAQELGLELSTEKTRITSFKEGFSFLGFDIKQKTAKMRQKSVEKFKDKIRELTIRSQNLDARVITKLNQVIRGTVNYFITAFSSCHGQFRQLYAWTRMRLRCMRYKRKSRRDNYRWQNKHITRLGLIPLETLACAQLMRQRTAIPLTGQSLSGSPSD